MSSSASPPRGIRALAGIVGPGIVVAATGVGAGDMVAAAKAGAAYGMPVLWTAAVGAILKFALAEGVARWQLATGSTLLEGWGARLGIVVQILFLAYLALWSLIVAAALMAACGLATHALIPAIPVAVGGAFHGLAAFAFVWFEGYGRFETAMKIAAGTMFVAILGTAAVQAPPLAETLAGLTLPRVPAGSTLLLLGVVGGVGGTLTLLSYSYWMQEKGWEGAKWLPAVRFDLGVGYALTGVFGVALVSLAAGSLHPRGIAISGSEGVLEMAQLLGARFGRPGELVFLVGFWGAVASSTLGVWQGVPYLFADYVGMMRRRGAPERPDTRGRLYRGWLTVLTVPPMTLLLLGKPVWLVVAYAALGALFMPFLAATLLWLNNRRDLVGDLRNGPLANLALVACLALFGYLAWTQLGRG
ncbi:MAG TPA: Nramp family divalent metal transporter [bacterium]|nr:Nramp family divalent metal transporter [bacterium]